jgi:dimethylhistidine N-methyltransferase
MSERITAEESPAEELARFRHDVHAALAAPPGSRSISPKWLYDDRGSELFERICDLEEYYVTRLELDLLEQRADEIAAVLGPRVRLVEPGSGAGIKVDVLLRALEAPTAFVPVEISEAPLVASAERLARQFPDLVVQGVKADFTRPFELPPAPPGTRRTAVFFPGSTVGNFEEITAVKLLERFAAISGDDGGVLIGVDLVKPEPVLLDAYDDPHGVTAQFTLNVLRRMRDELGAELDVDGFRHVARYERNPSRVVLGFAAEGDQTIELDGKTYALSNGDFIRTEYSHKPSVEDFAGLVADAGLRIEKSFLEERGWFGLFWLVRA